MESASANDNDSAAARLRHWASENKELFEYLLTCAFELFKETQQLGSDKDAIERLYAADPEGTIAAKAGVSRQAFHAWRTGKIFPSPTNFQALIDALPTLKDELEGLVEIPRDEPTQLSERTHMWNEKCFKEELGGMPDTGCAWVLRWANETKWDQVKLECPNLSDPGLPPLRDGMSEDEEEKAIAEWKIRGMPELAKKALIRWKSEFPSEWDKCTEGNTNVWGSKVRIHRVTTIQSHPGGRTNATIHLSPIRFLFYRSIQHRLGERQRELIELRNDHFSNALTALQEGKELELPSVFALHMAVVSEDHKAMIRWRDPDLTQMYPEHWECTVGEMMHGPLVKGEYRHFDDQGKPHLDWFLCGAVAEELGYKKAKPEQFLLYGFAAEYWSLAPKLMVVYRSDADSHTLCRGARKGKAKDFTRSSEAIDLTPVEVARAMREKKWAPTSKLALMLALRSVQRTESKREDVTLQVRKLLT